MIFDYHKPTIIFSYDINSIYLKFKDSSKRSYGTWIMEYII